MEHKGRSYRVGSGRMTCVGVPDLHLVTSEGVDCKCSCNDCTISYHKPTGSDTNLCICPLCTCGETSRSPRWRAT